MIKGQPKSLLFIEIEKLIKEELDPEGVNATPIVAFNKMLDEL